MYMYVCMYVYIYVCIYVCMYMCMCVCMYMYVYIHHCFVHLIIKFQVCIHRCKFLKLCQVGCESTPSWISSINTLNMEDLLGKINSLLNEADSNIAKSVKKHLLSQFHNELKKDAIQYDLKSELPNLVQYFPGYLDTNKDEVLLANIEIELDKIMKENPSKININKSQTSSLWIGSVPYSYTGSSHPIFDLTNNPAISDTMDHLNKDERFGGFNSCLLINYPDEHAALSLHSDDEKDQLDLSHPIAIIHVGGSRDLEFYPKSYLKSHRHVKLAPVKTVSKEHGSLTVMYPGCQEALCHRVAKSSDKKPGCWALSFRKVPTEESSAEASFHSAEISFNNPNRKKPVIPKKPMTLILGTSITVDLKEEKMARRNNICHNISGHGHKIADIDKELDKFYKASDEFSDCQVVKVIISVGTNDIRNCKGNINHLKTPLTNLIDKIKLYFPGVKVFLQSVLPVRIENEFTVRNVKRFNSMLFNTCREHKCFYIDIFRNFLTVGGHFNESLFKHDGCHLKIGCLGILARSFIRVINSREIFNPLIA